MLMEKVSAHSKQTIPVMEHFYTLQGEGSYMGHAAYFIRLGGCDVGCVWCDVKESWDVNAHPLLMIDELVSEARAFPGRLAVITGGEPAMHNMSYLTEALQHNGFRTHIETSGVYPLTGQWDWICFSPKKFKAPHQSIYQQAHELKVVVYHPSDIAWAEEYAAKVAPFCKLFLQPEWSKSDTILPQIIEYVKNNPKWQISLQVHKYMNIP
jgi:7-carboxy-7-deazaguanine synthase